jgi:putative endonuclease
MTLFIQVGQQTCRNVCGHTMRKKGAKYTKNRTPVSLVYFEVYETKQEAMQREYHIKQLSREDKLRLVESMDLSRLSLE